MVEEDSTDVEEFLTVDDDLRFQDWIKQHEDGFYLNQSSRLPKDGRMLHKATCKHLNPRGEHYSSTAPKRKKAAHISREKLKVWAAGKGLTVVACGTCNPDKT